MSSGNVDLHARYINALRTQAKTVDIPPSGALPCPFCAHQGKIFLGTDQLFSHVKVEHVTLLQDIDSARARTYVTDEALKLKVATDRSSETTAGGGSSPDLGTLSLSPCSGEKRPAETEFQACRGKLLGPTKIYIDENPGDTPYTISGHIRPKQTDSQETAKDNSTPYRAIPGPSSEWYVEANQSQVQASQPTHPLPNPLGQLPHRGPWSQSGSTPQRQPSLLNNLKWSSRYPGLPHQPASRPVSQEQLVSEVHVIYERLIMFEKTCIGVHSADRDINFLTEHWPALISLHMRLLHEHCDLFLACQHPSASPSLRKQASELSLPRRVWKHGMHSFIELLISHLPTSKDYLQAFIYLAYQIMSVLYETVPAFEDDWIEILGDLGRYRMAIEVDDNLDRATWAGVARAWYSKAADRKPTVGYLNHHLAILAKPNALKQLCYYARSLTSVKPFAAARDPISTLLDYSHASFVNNNFIQAHTFLLNKSAPEAFDNVCQAFYNQLDDHISSAKAEWKEQGGYIAVTNIAGLFDYGSEDSTLRQIMLLHAKHMERNPEARRSLGPSEEHQSHGIPANQIPVLPSITEADVPSRLAPLSSDFTFPRAYMLTMTTFALVLRRFGDENVLPHIHVLLSFLSGLALIPNVAPLVNHAPWSEIVDFLNALKPDRNEQLIGGPVFPSEQKDNLPLPEDYLIRGQLWSQWYFPAAWFMRERDEEHRSLELDSTVRSRTERILHLGHHISTLKHWISYDPEFHTFFVLPGASNVEP